ncbi:hypothetical protein SK128_020500, partial [Halocaridina rubra]
QCVVPSVDAASRFPAQVSEVPEINPSESDTGTDAVACAAWGCWESPTTRSNIDNQFHIDSIKRIATHNKE